MPRRLSLLICAVASVCFFPVSMGIAQQPVSPAPEQSQSAINPDWQSKLEDRTERQEFREEARKIREDHEDLEMAHDRLKVRCMNVKGQDRTACHDEWMALQQQLSTLHERMHSLHEKMQAEYDHVIPTESSQAGQWRAAHETAPDEDPSSSRTATSDRHMLPPAGLPAASPGSPVTSH